ncbi:MAG: hypothetical protein HY291_01360 [Planctomycetes bacterium]|nr:hypothetical protein [Planctomycetota bacterium]
MRTMLAVPVSSIALCCCLVLHAADNRPPPVVVNPPPAPPTVASATAGSGTLVAGQSDEDPNNRVRTVHIGNASITGQDAQTDVSGQMAVVTHTDSDAPPPANNPPANGNNAGPALAAPAVAQPFPKPEMPEAVPIPKFDTKVFDDAAPWLGLNDDQRATIAALKKRLTDEADRLSKAQAAARAKYTDALTPVEWNSAAQEVTRVAKELLNFQPERRFAQTLVLLLDKDQWALYQEKLSGKKK